ncbi:putative fatty acyl-CoA reductase-like protein [Leptotrombidium deliense]|uniref:Putative fatty acyl-CoA reductase-like protein n=1 Tax=Leptotrombidium deliense TaxID=299467 RepID=A0A443SNQ3_9ACAR|nr:putative fatty acyl-CoA reductase-like protein [Leptotrombidium deliense]
MHKGLDVFKFFANNEWHFKSDNFKELIESLNNEDKKEFPIDVRNMDCFVHIERSIKFARRHILKENEKTIPFAIMKYKL